MNLEMILLVGSIIATGYVLAVFVRFVQSELYLRNLKKNRGKPNDYS